MNRQEATTFYLTEVRQGKPEQFSNLIEPYRNEIQVHCYQMLGSLQDAEDHVQESFLRAWKHLQTFEERASFRAWLYKIATNVCLDTLRGRKRRTLPHRSLSASDPQTPFSPPNPDPTWLDPLPDSYLNHVTDSAEAHYTMRDSIRLAFMIALQNLPPRQRAVLILRDVLDWRAKEVSDHLSMSVSAVTSALHRARKTLAQQYLLKKQDSLIHLSHENKTLLDQYLFAWETADISGLTYLLKQDATFSMPPSTSWYQGRDDIASFLSQVIFAQPNQNQWRLVPIEANSQAAFALYQNQSNTYNFFAIQVLTVANGHITDVVNFINPDLSNWFDLPGQLVA